MRAAVGPIETTTTMKVLAVIPARGGSKGIPRKNLASFLGRPLVTWSVEHALESETVDRTIVSTDDPEIAGVAEAAGAEVPFMRPAELAEDHVLDLPVFTHALAHLSAEGYRPDLVVHLRPTCPWRETGWIDEAVHRLADSDADALRSVSTPAAHPYRVFEIDPEGHLTAFVKHIDEPYLLRRQDHPPVYHYNCVLDVTRPRTIEGGSMTGDHMLPYVIPAARVVDIDSAYDLWAANRLFAHADEMP